MAPHVSRFLARLFSIGAEAEAHGRADEAYDDLFRFKIDFVRRRALPLLKGGAHVEATADDHVFVDGLLAAHRRMRARASLRWRGRAATCWIAKKRHA